MNEEANRMKEPNRIKEKQIKTKYEEENFFFFSILIDTNEKKKFSS